MTTTTQGEHAQPEALRPEMLDDLIETSPPPLPHLRQRGREMGSKQAITPVIGGFYNWIGQPERLVYLGAKRYAGDPRAWHQFAKVEDQHMCWCEVLVTDLDSFEETKDTP